MLDISRGLYIPIKSQKNDDMSQKSLEEKVEMLEQEVFNTYSHRPETSSLSSDSSPIRHIQAHQS